MKLLLKTLILPLLFMAGACQSAPIANLPDPLPETVEWARADAHEGAFLGLKTRENDSGSLDDLFFESGVRVTRVVESSPAAEAGFEVGDVLLSFAGSEVNDPGALDALLTRSTGGQQVDVQVQRGDTVFAVPVTLRALGSAGRAQPEALYRLDPARSRAGWSTGRGGAVLVSSDDEGPFPQAGVEVGSVVLRLDGEQVLSDRDLIRSLQAREPGAQVLVSYLDGEGEEHSCTVDLQATPTRFTGYSVPILSTYKADPDGASTNFVLIDLYFISLFRYRREGKEREWRFLRFFSFSSGIGELSQ